MHIHTCSTVVQGTESDAELAQLDAPGAVFALLETPDDVSRIHAARRVFQHLHDSKSTLSVVHHVVYKDAKSLNRDQFLLGVGSEVRACFLFLFVFANHCDAAMLCV
jgi:(E)-4-hydroxy-3-methylbut-2-enyl-diphosphate synthase